MASVPNIASVLKAEISRVARKEVRSNLLGLRKAAGVHRTEVAALKQRVQALVQALRRLSKASTSVAPATTVEESSRAFRFSAKGLASQRQRQRLGLSAEDRGQLVGASGESILNWEAGKARPMARHLPALVALRTLGKEGGGGTIGLSAGGALARPAQRADAERQPSGSPAAWNGWPCP
jgi:hypothetical protein